MKEKAFYNWRMGAFHLNFENGNKLSTTFAGGSYSENHSAWREFINPLEKPVESNDCEIMFTCDKKLQRKIEKIYNEGIEQPIGYLNITQWTEIVKLLSK
jgi:hypothetical protein